MPAQSWLPDGQTPAHDEVAGMQSPAHRVIPGGQVPPHIVPSHVAVPPVGTGHGTQAEPQLATSLLSTQIPTQLCVPSLQALPASPPAPPAPPPPASAAAPSSPPPRSTPASSGRSDIASSTAEPPSTWLFIVVPRERAELQPPATTSIKKPAAR
jgi:hypothetical protein